VGRRAPLDAVLRYVARVMPPPVPILPPGTRWLCRRKDLLQLVVEHPPQCRTVRVSRGKKGADDYQPFRLAFPYILYVLTFYRDGFEEMKMFFRNHTLSALGDTLYHTNLPNVGGNRGTMAVKGSACRYRPEMLEGVPLAESVPALIEFFLEHRVQSGHCRQRLRTGPDPGPAFCRVRSLGGGQFGNPLFPLEVEWEPAGRDLPGLWAECLKLHGETDQPVGRPRNWRISCTGCRWATESARVKEDDATCRYTVTATGEGENSLITTRMG